MTFPLLPNKKANILHRYPVTSTGYVMFCFKCGYFYHRKLNINN